MTHPSSVRHAGQGVTRGVRYVLVVFVNRVVQVRRVVNLPFIFYCKLFQKFKTLPPPSHECVSLQDRTDHARRCKRRGVDARKRGELEAALGHYGAGMAFDPEGEDADLLHNTGVRTSDLLFINYES